MVNRTSGDIPFSKTGRMRISTNLTTPSRLFQNQLNALETSGFVKQQEYLKSQMRSYRKGFSEERNLLVQLGS